MASHRQKIYLAITVIVVAVILLVVALYSFFNSPNKDNAIDLVEEILQEDGINRHPLSGAIVDDENDFFAVAIMIDNSYDVWPQEGLGKADIIYEALAEGNITRFLAIFDSRQNLDKVGPIRSARPYFMDWASEYQGAYMHVGGSPRALSAISDYDFLDVNQIGAGEKYFWRDNDLMAPHNVFSSSANWLRVGEIRDIENIDSELVWNFIQVTSSAEQMPDFSIEYNGPYKVDWNYNSVLEVYQRWQADEKFIYNNGKQASAENIIVQVVDARIIDSIGRRDMDTQEGGKVYIFNTFGQQEGVWEIKDGRTRFLTDDGQDLELVAGKTWVEIIPAADYLVVK